MAGKTEIAIAVDADAGAGHADSISPAMADAAMPFEALADVLEKPVHVIAASARTPPAKYCVIRLSLTQKPPEPAEFLLNGDNGPAIWLWARNAETLRSAAISLSLRSAFPEMP